MKGDKTVLGTQKVMKSLSHWSLEKKDINKKCWQLEMERLGLMMFVNYQEKNTVKAIKVNQFSKEISRF